MSSEYSAEHWMHEALREAKKAKLMGEVPIGAVIVADDKIIARAHNEVESRQDATAHAETLVIQRASEALGQWRLPEVSLYVTLEPCSICIGALILARVRTLYYGCSDPRQGAVGSLFDLSDHPTLPHSVVVHGGVLEVDCRRLLQDFFAERRGVLESTGELFQLRVGNE